MSHRRVTATEARVHFGEILRSVQDDGQTIVVERGGRDAAVILPVAEYRRGGAQKRSRQWRARIATLHARWQAETGKPTLSDAAEVIRLDRAERDAQLGERPGR